MTGTRTGRNVEIFSTFKAAESKRREHEAYGQANWGGQVTFFVEEFGEGWAVCEVDEDGVLICFY